MDDRWGSIAEGHRMSRCDEANLNLFHVDGFLRRRSLEETPTLRLRFWLSAFHPLSVADKTAIGVQQHAKGPKAASKCDT
jgi:hypothetical protein